MTIATPALDTTSLASHPAWLRIKTAATALQPMQAKDGSIEDAAQHAAAREHVDALVSGVRGRRPLCPHDDAYLEQVAIDLERWAAEGFVVPDFFDSRVRFQPQEHRIDGLTHLVVFPMLTQNGSTSRLVEAVLVQVIWPEFIDELEATQFSNALFVPIRFIDFTAGYDTNSAVLFPETVAMREIPKFTWGAIFQDREAARFRTVLRAAVDVTRLELPVETQAMLDDQSLTEEVFVMWDLIHDRTHMRGDLPFDPFMIKQRMPFFLYSLEELRCDLTAFRESVAIERGLRAKEQRTEAEERLMLRARLVQHAVIFDRIFRFAVTGSRVRNYDGLGGQLLFAWLHQHRVLHWTDTQLAFDWDEVPDVVNQLGEQIEQLYWRSIDRPKVAHWLAAYALVAGTVEPHPASRWKSGDLPLDGTPRALTDLVMDDEFPLSMFYEAFEKKMRDVVASTAGITGATA